MTQPERPNSVHVRRAKNGEWYWRVIAPNGEELWRSSETYKNRHYAYAQALESNPDCNLYFDAT